MEQCHKVARPRGRDGCLDAREGTDVNARHCFSLATSGIGINRVRG
jgi:hypothetical protein